MSYLKKFTKRTERKNLKNAGTSLDATISIVIKDLKVQLQEYYVHYELSAKLKTFDTLSNLEKRTSFPSLYLEVEDFLSLQPNANFDTVTFRQKIIKTYPLLKEQDELRTIFVKNNDTQKVILSKLFLKDVLIKSKDLLGNFDNPFLIKVENLLVHTPLSFELITQQQAASILK